MMFLPFAALGIIMYYILQDFPGDDERHFVGKPVEIPLFIGSCLFALEAVGVVCCAFRKGAFLC